MKVFKRDHYGAHIDFCTSPWLCHSPHWWIVSKFCNWSLLRRQVRSDWFVYVVLSCLPWVGKELYEKKDVEMDRLLSQIEGYLKYVPRFG